MIETKNNIKKPYSGNEDSLVFHIRITKKCNADCSYCSSWQSAPAKLLNLKDLEKAVDFIAEKIKSLGLGGKRKSISVQYVGGELLSTPSEYLRDYSEIVEKKLSPLFDEFTHGGQSNLIGSTKKVDELLNIFDGNLGTSFDHFTNQRTVLGDAKKYQTILLKNISHVQKSHAKSLSGIVVVDKAIAPYIEKEIELANERRSHITLRPVFDGGSPVNKLSVDELNSIYIKLYENWMMKQRICIEPFFSYTKKRIFNKLNENISSFSGCPSQHNCALTSINMDPDGTLYLCQEMSDSDYYVLGNAVKGEWNHELHEQMKARTYKLNTDCINCEYFKECQGGCMKEAVEYTKEGLYGKTVFCKIWKSIFYLIDKDIEKYGIEEIKEWLEKIEYIY